jgi:Rps23 Pro-64 3,4-dihydroxylase Tpa1-like proline 4-hydroxylase
MAVEMAMPVQRRRGDLAQMISDRLDTYVDAARAQWAQAGTIASAVIDDLLPAEIAAEIHSAFPSTDRMILRSSIKEHKHIAAQMNLFDPLLEEIVYAFQDGRVVERIARITGIEAMEPDAELYAGGISAMSKGAYLRPHLDNSHDKRRERYRVLNLLYYVTPGWAEAYGGSLQLWDHGPDGAPRTIPSRFNRLVLMPTNKRSWHSVNQIVHDGTRCCVSNYYFSRQSPEAQRYSHATSFRAEYGAGVSDIVMRADNALRSAVLKLTGDRLYRNPHGYKRDDPR